MEGRYSVAPYRNHDAPISLREAAIPGLISGGIGALAMGTVAILLAALRGDFFLPLKLVAATLLGENAFVGFSGGPVLLGTILHFMTAFSLGIFFAWLGGYLSPAASTAWGIIFGLAIWVIMQYGILPVINPFLAAMPGGAFAATHVVFGISLGQYSRFLPARREAEEHFQKAA